MQRLSSIHIRNFVGLAAVDMQDMPPVTLVAGRNGSGKSSLRDAIALALTGELTRVHLKKDAGGLVRFGAAEAVCEVKNTDGDTWTTKITAAGKITSPIGKKGTEADPVLPLVLDAQRFARLEPNDRRSFLFSLMGVGTDSKAVGTMLLARGHHESRVGRIQPLLRSGFAAAHTQANAYATEARGAWRALTGENYGSEKAATWQAGVPAVDVEGMPKLQTEVKHAEAALETWQRKIGALQAQKQRRTELQSKLAPLDEKASMVERLTKKLETDQANLADVEQRLAAAQAAAGSGPRVGLVHDLAAALYTVSRIATCDDAQRDKFDTAMVSAADALMAYTREHGALGKQPGDPEAADRLPVLRQAHATCTSALANTRRDLEAATAAGVQAQTIREELAQPFDEAELATANAEADKIRTQRDAAQQRLDTQAALRRQADMAEAKTQQALAHHQDVLAWVALADALAPDGIPAEMLRQALEPLRERLAQSAADTGWPVVQVDDDMTITLGGRPRALCSESEQWRCDAVLAEAISHISGTGILVLDRFDLLDLPGRSEALGWLETLADTGEIGTAVVMATLKGLPSGLPPHIGAHWIEHGRIGTVLQAA